MSVWVTRSAPGNLATARGLKALGRTPFLAPVLTTRPVPHRAPAGLPDVLVFSSVHAVRHHRAPEDLRAVPVFVASEPIAAAALAAGYHRVTSTGGSEDALGGMLSHIMPPRGRVALFCAERTGNGLRERLPPSVLLDRTVVYEPVALDDGDLAAVRIRLGQVDAITVHSRTAAERLVPLIDASGWRGRVWCISSQACDRLSSLPGLSVATAERPTEDGLMALVARHGPAARTAPFSRKLPIRSPRRPRSPANDNALPDRWR